MLLYAFTVFLGAFLLFQVQPILGKAVLPWFGGVPAVWSTCLVFFQLVLLAGYSYAHGLARFLTSRAARALHVALILVSVAVLAALAFRWGSPILPGSGWKPADADQPVQRILAILGVSIGLPYLLLSSTSPLIQAWAARTTRAPASIGSTRSRTWGLCWPSRPVRLLSSASSLSALRPGSGPWATPPSPPPPSSAPVSRLAFPQSPILNHQSPITSHQSPVTNLFSIPSPGPPVSQSPSLSILWFALAAAGSMMLMATTNQMCQEVASIPFLWVFPLCLYLASFILCFQSDRLYNRGVFGPLFVAASC